MLNMTLTHILRSSIVIVLFLHGSTAFATGNGSMQDSEFVVSGNMAFFQAMARSTTGINQLWKTDGTEAGTVLITDFGERKGIGRIVATQKGIAFFLYTRHDEDLQLSLWRSDGTSDGTVHVADIGNVFLEGPSVNADGTMLFFTVDGHVLWRSDMTRAGTIPLVKLPRTINTFALSGPFLFFTLEDCFWCVTRPDLWRTDGTPEGTMSLGRPAGGPLARIGEHDVLFESDGELWRNDGTADGSTRIASFAPREIKAAGDSAYVTTSFVELLGTDGTSAGTHSVFHGSGVGWLLPDHENVYFVNQSSWWYYDARSERAENLGIGTRALATVAGDSLYTAGFEFDGGVWIKRPGASQLRLTASGLDLGHRLIPFGNKVLFAGTSSRYGTEPWITDGTVQGTRMLANIFPEARFQGTVIDGDTGRPVEGASVVLSLGYRRGLYTLQTDRNGRFSAEMADGDYTVEVSHNDYVALKSPETFAARGGSTLQDTHLVLYQGGGISGRVVDGSGAPVGGMTIAIQGPAGFFQVLTRTDGTYQTPLNLERNQWWVIRTSGSGDYSGVVYPGIGCYAGCDAIQQGTRVITTENRLVTGIDFVVQPLGRVRGRLLDKLTRQPILRPATVYVSASDLEKTPVAGGQYNVRLPDGGATLSVIFPSEQLHKNTQPSRMVVPAGTTITVDILVDPAGARITGRVVDARMWQPQAGVRVAISAEDGELAAMVTTETDGTYSTEPQFRQGRYYARVEQAGGWMGQEWKGGKAIVVTDAVVIPHIDFSVDVRTMISGVIRDSLSGHPLRDVAVQLYGNAGNAVGPTRRTDANGRYTAPASPGVYIVKAGKFGWKPASSFVGGALLSVADTPGEVEEANLSLTPSCITTLLPASASFGPYGGRGTLTLSATCQTCSFSSSSFIRLPASCASAGEVTYTVAANRGDTRTGWILVPGGALKIEQRGRSAD